MSLLIASLYLLCISFLFGSAVYVYSRDPFERLNATYAFLAFALLGWVGTLFVYTAQPEGAGLLWLGRANFAAAALASTAAYAFMLALAQRRMPNPRLVWGETLLLAAVSVFSGAVDMAETGPVGQHASAYGPLFPLYCLHILAFTAAALAPAVRSRTPVQSGRRTQVRLVGAGVLLTVLVGFVTNAVLPYWYHDFSFINAGTLATIFFLAAVAYAACFRHLFNVRILVRKAAVYAVLIAFALEVYQVAITFLAELLPLSDPAQRHIAGASVALVINAIMQQPLRLWLERIADLLAEGRHSAKKYG